MNSMDDQAKAMHALALQREGLIWSRLRTTITVQGGMLAAGYAIAANRPLAIILLSLGMGLTLLISAMIRRDLAIRERAFEASELAPPEVARRRGSWLREREVLRLVFLIFLAADIILLVWISRGEV